MSDVTIGSLFSGAGALCELALAPLLGGRVVWHCEYEPPSKKTPKPTQAAARVLAHRFPGTPNLGDITKVDWSAVPPVRVMTGGFPCTDVSLAGAQAGLTPDTRSGTWTYMAHAIDMLRPELVVIENVRGLASSPAHSDVEPCAWCMGAAADQPLRALGAVLGDLADRGYDAVWCGLRASDLGACHERFRFVIAAAPRDTAPFGWHPASVAGERRQPAGTVGGPDRVAQLSSGDLTLPTVVAQLLPTPTARDWKGRNQRDDATCLPGAVDRLLPTPTASRYGNNQSDSPNAAVRPSLESLSADLEVDWGIYESAIRRHEAWMGRPVPAPRVDIGRGKKKLNPQLSEWMMGWPAGWVTDVPGLTLNEQLQVCGNGVVPQQMAAGVAFLLPILFNQREHGGAAA